MGRSKFPGKPTKLVNKKRISVLSGNCTNNSDNLVNNIEDDFDTNDFLTSNEQINWNNQNGLITTTTKNLQSNDGDSNNIQKIIETLPEQQSPPSKPPDDNMSFDNEIEKTNKKNNSGGVQTRARSNPAMHNKNVKEEQQQSPQQIIKKKTVTFKNVLETSDDVIVKKVYNPDNAPLVPIIKKECLIRSSRLFKTECIVRPSRLTEILKNNENNIDKLNSITFRTVPHVSTSLLTSTPSLSSNKNNNSDVVIGDKRFILPKRSVHSCRVIKPNKRFLDDVENIVKRKVSTSCGVKKLSSKRLADGTDDCDESVKNENEEEDVDEEDDEDEDEDENDEDESDISKSEQDESDCSQSENKIKQQENLIISPSTSMKVILRQPRLQFPLLSTLGMPNINDGPFSMNHNNNSTNNMGSLTSLSACRICGTESLRFIEPTQKFGVVSCEACRKFISKTIKRLAVTSVANTQQHKQNTIECFNNDGFCIISPLCQKKNHLKPLRSTIKDRCQACWLKKCVKTFQIPSGLRHRLIGTLPINMRDLDICNKGGSSSQLSPFSIKKETNDKNSTNNIFATSSLTCGRLLSRPQDCIEMDYKTSKILSLTNSLAENNSTFGSLPLIKPNITEKPIIMINSNIDIIKSDFIKKDSKQQINGANLNKIQNESESNKLDEINKIKTRKKDREQTPQILSPTMDQSKRQRIDLKGPRVKHVCRSASIVLGQPIATFPNESPLLESMDTPPRPDSPNNDIVDIAQSITVHTQNECTDCVTNPDELGLSPPATPIEREDSELTVLVEETKDDDLLDIEPECFTISYKPQDNTSDSNKENRKIEESQKPVTRKLTRPALLSQNVSNLTNRININSITRKQEPPAPPVISIDFWENYDPAEVSRTGFGLIVTETVPLRALCFLCGSSGLDPLIFCVCCCEPYHQYCVEDEYNLKQPILDETGTSFLDNTSILNQSSLSNRLNWLCPRCTVCYTCNMSSGSKLKCQKCQKNYHSTCLGTSKRLLGSDRPLICANCLKCKSCGTSNVSKFVGNLPMCQACFKLRQRGNFCPLCQKCYEDNDFDLKMMECGDCKRWVHAKCEGVPDEQYNMLSALPENIEFICKKCSKNNTTSDTWREAVLAEFKSGLLSVIKLLSKSRQACALLKLSPRKKSINCICQPMMSNRCIQFSPESQLNDEADKNSIDGDIEVLDDGFRCFCGAVQRQQMNFSSSVPTLMDVKRKINASEYYSVQDFNYDMQLVINAVACDDLLTTYKEILSETFPWFQNETKACTDALVEDMYDSSSYNETTQNIEIDQQVPMIDVPEDSDNYFYSTVEPEDNRVCMFCKSIGEGMAHHESRLLYCGHNTWVHTNCALWSAEVFEEIDGSLQNVHSAIKRGRAIKCSRCRNKGATVGCNAKKCDEQFHYSCARSVGCAFLLDKTVYCPNHIVETSERKSQLEKNFEVLRPVYVELDRRKKKMIDPSNIQFLIGSLCVKKLGNFIPVLSDFQEAIVPTDFLCTRLFWSSKEPWKIVEYTVKTSIENNLSQSYDTGKNFTVDHSSNYNIVQLGLAQITKYHNSLVPDEDYDLLLRNDKTVKQLIDTVLNNSNEETNEEEPQNNGDLLPDEIKDVIFDDLPHELLDGISMLDILPKLMTYEDLVALDMKNEAYFGGDLLKEGKEDLSDDEMDDNDKNTEMTIWPGTNSILLNAEDALLSTRLANATTSRELKRSKSEVFSRSIAANRSHQRSCSLTWSCKLDASTAAKRRKVSMFQDIKLPESVLVSFGRGDLKYRKEDFPENICERRRSLQNDENKTNRSVTWTATKKLINNDSITESDSLIPKEVLDRLKISQLDGVDDIGSGSDSGSPIYEHSSNIQLTGIYNPTNECPVKCDRCHCTYRTYESFQRHLPSCEPMSTSESESEATPISPENESPPAQQNSSGIMTSVSVSEVFSTNSINQFLASQNQNPTLSFLPQLNGQNLIHNVTLANSIPITNLQNTMAPIHNVNNNNLTNAIPINSTNIQNHLQHGMSNMLVTTSQNQHQQQLFTQSIPVNNFQPQIFPLQNQFQTTNTLQQHTQQQPQNSQIITLPNGINIQNFNNQTTQLIQPQHQPQQNNQNQTQIIQISTPNGPQLMTITPQHLKTNGTIPQPPQQQQLQLQQQHIQQQTVNSPIKNQLILPLPEKNMSKKQTRFQSPSVRGKGRPVSNSKPIQMKRVIKPENKPNQIMNTNFPIGRTNMPNQNGQNVIFQPQNSQPIIVQQMGNNQNNLVQYVTDGNNTMQYIMPTATNDFKQPQQQYLTQNPMVSGTYQLQTDAAGNLVLANAPAGISVLPLAQTQQPQVIGTILQPQSTHFQCGMMASEQMVLGSTPALEMVTDPASGCMYLTSQPVYYGLETIVRNTVMSSQQFVSTAMQGVLSQNSSFSATTTQVFQASKIEPFMEMPTGYVVLNNVNDQSVNLNMMPPQNQQQNLVQTNAIQQPTVHQIQPQLQPQQGMQSQSTWRFVKDEGAQNLNIQQPQQQIQPAMSPKPTIKPSSVVVTKIQPQIINKVTPHGTPMSSIEQKPPIILPKLTPVTDQNTYIPQTNLPKVQTNATINSSKTAIITAPPPTVHRATAKSVAVKPKLISKSVNANKIQYSAATTIKPIINSNITPSPVHSSIPTLQLNVPIKPSQQFQCEIMNTIVEKEIVQPTTGEEIISLQNLQNQIMISRPIDEIHENQIALPNSLNIPQQAPAVVLPHQAPHQQQNTSASQTTISLPIAPYPPHSNGIPMSVVNPIQQYHNNITVTRPTNRVLPMQTHQLKPSPPSSPIASESKLITVNQEKLQTIDQTIKENLPEIILPSVVKTVRNIVNSDNESKSFENFIKNNEKLVCSNSILNITIHKDHDEQMNSINEVIKNESIMLDSKDECDTTDVKEKICQILVNLENEDCNRNIVELDETTSYSELEERQDLDQKENLNPESETMVKDEMNSRYQQRSPLKENYYQPTQPIKSTGPKLLYEIQSQDGFTYKSTSISEVWNKVFEAVQIARKSHGLVALPEGPLGEMSGFQMLGLKTNALKYLLEQLPGVEKCDKYIPKYHKRDPNQPNILSVDYSLELEDFKENEHGAIRCEPYISRSEYDMFSWLASRHRKQPAPVVVVMENDIAIPRRGSGSNLPMAMRYRTLKETSKESVGVYRSHIHGRGLFCTRDIEAGEMVIEYAGELIRSTLTDKREKYYDSKGIGCYMFKIDDNLVVDATMRGNAARFINHSCEPNCYSKVVDILGHKHIIIFALRRIVQGEELTYDYKFPFEDVKIPCSCGSKRCRKYLN